MSTTMSAMLVFLRSSRSAGVVLFVTTVRAVIRRR